jgi:pimeloyl-ACP methyl ester carboxylesterase
VKVVVAPSGAALHYDDRGDGRCVVALHGAYSTHHEIRGFLEPMLESSGTRRLYPDLPGMGASPAHASIGSSNDVLDVLDLLVSTEVGSDPFLVVGHSYGGHLARGLASRHPGQVAGLALICPLMPAGMHAEPHVVVRVDGDTSDLIDAAHLDDYRGYFVIQTPETALRFRDAVVPALGAWDGAAVERVMTDWALDPDPDTTPFDAPTLVLTGRHDSTVGFRDQFALVDRYRRATFVVVDDAGHALPHERADIVATLLDDWLTRT